MVITGCVVEWVDNLEPQNFNRLFNLHRKVMLPRYRTHVDSDTQTKDY